MIFPDVVDGLFALNSFKSVIKFWNFCILSTTSGKIIIQDTVKHYQNPTIALHAKDEKTGNETFVVSNFSSLDYPSYNIEFPVGSWVEVINSNDEKYGGTGMCQNARIVNGFGHTGNSNLKSKIALPAKSSIIFKRI